jgi:hypothetical protein
MDASGDRARPLGVTSLRARIAILVGLLSFFTMGYQAGLSTASRSPATIVLALTFVAVICLVADLDRPGEGFLRVSQEPMIEVQRMMRIASSSGTDGH